MLGYSSCSGRAAGARGQHRTRPVPLPFPSSSAPFAFCSRCAGVKERDTRCVGPGHCQQVCAGYLSGFRWKGSCCCRGLGHTTGRTFPVSRAPLCAQNPPPSEASSANSWALLQGILLLLWGERAQGAELDTWRVGSSCGRGMFERNNSARLTVFLKRTQEKPQPNHISIIKVLYWLSAGVLHVTGVSAQGSGRFSFHLPRNGVSSRNLWPLL